MYPQIKNGLLKILYIFAIAGASAVIAAIQNWLSCLDGHCIQQISLAGTAVIGTTLGIGAHFVHPDHWNGIMS